MLNFRGEGLLLGMELDGCMAFGFWFGFCNA